MIAPYYEQDGITIYHGDCRDVAPSLAVGAVDLLLTDPPYGMAFTSGWTASTAVSSDGDRQGARVVRTGFNALQHAFGSDMHALVFCHWKSWPDFHDHLCHLFAFRNALVWSKGGGGMGDLRHEYAKDFEIVLFGARGRGRELRGKRTGCVIEAARVPPAERDVPFQKPIGLLMDFIERHTEPSHLVLDPFMGCGSTLVAAQMCGRRAIGIEIDERYCEMATRRLAQGALPFANLTPGAAAG
jgi:site-specific DNA-methyltransferase (adenine-specific)